MSALVLWLTGLPGAGKTTVAQGVEAELSRRGLLVAVIDGDELRAGVSRDLGFSPEDREIQARRAASLADARSSAGATVLVALVSPQRTARETARKLLGARFREVYVRAALATCVRRDPKGLYARALRGEVSGVTGLDAAYEEPLAPDLLLDTDRETVAESVDRVLELLERLSARPLQSTNPIPQVGVPSQSAQAPKQ